MPIPSFPTVPAPGTYPASGPLLTSSLRADVTNAVTFLSNRPAFSGQNTSGPTIPSGAFTNVTLDTDLFDSWAGHSPLGTHPERYYGQAAGWHLAEGYVPWLYTAATQFAFAAALGVSVSGTVTTYRGQEHLIDSGQNPAVYAADLVQLLTVATPAFGSGDFVELQAFTSGAGLALQAAAPNNPTLSVRWVGTGAAASGTVPGNAAFPVPPSPVTQSWLNTNIRDTINFLANPPMLRATFVPGTQTIASGAAWPTPSGTVTLNTAVLDNRSGFNTGTSTYTIPAGCGGEYLVIAQVHFTPASNAATFYAAGATINGTTTWGNAARANLFATSDQIMMLVERFRLNAGDTVQLAGFQNSGGALSVQNQTKLVMLWESS